MEFVPVMSVPDKQKTRYGELRKKFQEKHGVPPVFYSRAPGRVNLIGEHIDYCGYAVLPMAIEQDVVIATAPDNDEPILQISNTNADYPAFSSPIADLAIDRAAPQWYHYFVCGLRGVLEHFGLSLGGVTTGLRVVVDGTVPRCAGLSSSSALVCAAAVAAMRNYDRHLTKLELAELCQHCERYIGTEGGGMDQAISFLAKEGTAKLIEFNPVRATDVLLPEGAVFVISNSCVELNKAATSHFNTRVAECRLGAQLMAESKRISWRDTRRPLDLQRHLDLSLEAMSSLVTDVLHSEAYGKQEICDALKVSPDELNKTSLSERTIDVGEFRLRQRALHVYGEAERVRAFQRVCRSPPEGALAALGALMTASHASCRDLYECSCPDLDDLVALATKSGALGSRLTGAGWGGCVVSLVPANQVAAFTDSLKKNYYEKCTNRLAKLGESLFTSQPGGGATIYVD